MGAAIVLLTHLYNIFLETMTLKDRLTAHAQRRSARWLLERTVGKLMARLSIDSTSKAKPEGLKIVVTPPRSFNKTTTKVIDLRKKPRTSILSSLSKFGLLTMS